jgi:hypothetical protein
MALLKGDATFPSVGGGQNYTSGLSELTWLPQNFSAIQPADARRFNLKRARRRQVLLSNLLAAIGGLLWSIIRSCGSHRK